MSKKEAMRKRFCMLRQNCHWSYWLYWVCSEGAKGDVYTKLIGWYKIHFKLVILNHHQHENALVSLQSKDQETKWNKESSSFWNKELDSLKMGLQGEKNPEIQQWLNSPYSFAFPLSKGSHSSLYSTSINEKWCYPDQWSHQQCRSHANLVSIYLCA